MSQLIQHYQTSFIIEGNDAIDNEHQRFIVGYIGEHMDNATTRNMH